jgi:carboxyl-terminal processing protease
MARLEEVEQGKMRRESNLRGALENTDEATEKPNSNAKTDHVKSADVADYQLSRAVDLLRGISFYNERSLN